MNIILLSFLYALLTFLMVHALTPLPHNFFGDVSATQHGKTIEQLVLNYESVRGYNLTMKLGGGSIGIVVQAKSITTSQTVAIKLTYMDPLVMMYADAELSAFKKIKDLSPEYFVKEIASLYVIYPREDGKQLAHHILAIVMEYVPSVNMHDFIFAPTSQVTKSVSSDRKGLQQLKQAKLCHRDIKPENFLVYTTKARMLSAKFIDFNCLVDADKATGDRRAGAQLFMAPEVYFQSGFKDCYSTDIYSTGMTLYESIFRREPFKIQRAKKLGIVSGSDPKVPMSTELWTLLVSMLSPNAQYRPTVEQILANPIWKKLG